MIIQNVTLNAHLGVKARSLEGEGEYPFPLRDDAMHNVLFRIQNHHSLSSRKSQKPFEGQRLYCNLAVIWLRCCHEYIVYFVEHRKIIGSGALFMFLHNGWLLLGKHALDSIRCSMSSKAILVVRPRGQDLWGIKVMGQSGRKGMLKRKIRIHAHSTMLCWFMATKIKSIPLWQNWIWTANEGTCQQFDNYVVHFFHSQGCCLEKESPKISFKIERVCLPKSVTP